MSISKMTLIMINFTADGTLVGGVIGFLIGSFAPDFYIATIGPGNPMHIGIGFGIAQGLMMGFIFACIVLVLSAFGRWKP